MENCPKCGSKLSEIEEKCSTCGFYVGPPNVRVAETPEEKEALDTRYRNAIEQSRTDGRELALVSFSENMKETCAVVNVDLDFLHQFIIKDFLTYSTYDLSVKGQMRKPATAENDRDRKTIGAMFFGTYAEEIRYAALSRDGAGPISYGPYALKLREITIADRSTLLEDNSYIFISKHKIEPRQEIPPGYRATWGERYKLAVAKLSEQVFASTTEAEHSKILLYGTGVRGTDEFIEVHIYGNYDSNAIESVRGSSAVKGGSSAELKRDLAYISIIKDCLNKAGKTWIEE